MLKEFYKRFGLENTLQESKIRFMTRVDISIFENYDVFDQALFGPPFIRWLSLQWGENWNQYIVSSYHMGEYINLKLTWKMIAEQKFERYLFLIESIYQYLLYKNKEASFLDNIVPDLIDKAEVDLGFFWKKGKFYPRGSKFLDKEVVEDILDWLGNFPQEKKDFENALKARLEKRDNDVIGDCYNCIEGIFRKTLNNNKTLENNKEEILAKLNFSKEWKGFIVNFLNYANTFKRHASEERYKVNSDEVEVFIYLTALITRMCIKKE